MNAKDLVSIAGEVRCWRERAPLHGPRGRCLGVFPCEIKPHGRDHHATSPDRPDRHRSGTGNHTDPASAAQRWAGGRGLRLQYVRTVVTPRDVAHRCCRASRRGSTTRWAACFAVRGSTRDTISTGPPCAATTSASAACSCRSTPAANAPVAGLNAACPHCGPGNDMGGEEVIEMQEVPDGVPMEPTPALKSETPPVPVEAVPPKAARGRSPQGQGRAAMHRAVKPNASPKTAQAAPCETAWCALGSPRKLRSRCSGQPWTNPRRRRV